MSALPMRRKLRRVHQEEVGLQIAPMIDVTLLLLFFFMLTGKFTRDTKLLDVALPRASTAVYPEDFSGRDIVNIDADGRLYAGERAVDLPELRRYLKARLDANPPLRIYVRADAKTPARQIKDVMSACADAGAIEVIFGAVNQ